MRPATGASRRGPLRRRAAVLLLAGLATTLCGIPASAGPATARPTSGSVPAHAAPAVTTPATTPAATTPAAATAPATGIVLSSIDPPVAQHGQAVTMAGEVVAGDTAAAAGRLEVVRAAATIVRRSDVTAWADGSTQDVPSGTVVASTPTPQLAAGTSASYSVVVPASELTTSRPYAALAFAVVWRTPGATTVLRTFVPVFIRKEFQPIHLAWALPVTLPADPGLYSESAATRSSAWQQTLGPGSRLQALVTSVGTTPVTWLLDPAVLDPTAAVPTPADGTATDTATAGTATTSDPVAAAAAEFAGDLTASSQTVWSLPYGDPDLAALLPTPQGAATIRPLVATAQSDNPAAVSVAWPVDGSLSTARADQLRSAYPGGGPGATLVSSAEVRGRSVYTTTAPARTSQGDPVLIYDSRLSRTADGATSPSAATVSTQQALADSIALLDESPGITRDFLVVLPRDTTVDPVGLARLMTTVDSAPWVSADTTTSYLATARTATPGAGLTPADSTATVPETPLSPAVVTRLTTTRTELAQAASVVSTDSTQQQALSRTWDDEVTALLSTRWRGKAAGWATLEQAVATHVSSLTKGISVRSATLNFLAEQGALQVTVSNDLDQPIHDLHLVLRPQSSRLVVLGQPEPVAIGAHSKTTVRVEVQAVAAGNVRVIASLRSASGMPVGTSAEILVKANPPASWWYWAFAGVNLLLVIIGVARSLRGQRRRSSSLGASASTHLG